MEQLRFNDWLERDAKEEDPDDPHHRHPIPLFPYVLVCSTAATIVGLASVWIATAISYAPVMVA